MQHGPWGIRHNWHQEAGGTSTTAQVRMPDSLLAGPPFVPRNCLSSAKATPTVPSPGAAASDEYSPSGRPLRFSCNYSPESSGLYTLSPILIRTLLSTVAAWTPFSNLKITFFSHFFPTPFPSPFDLGDGPDYPTTYIF